MPKMLFADNVQPIHVRVIPNAQPDDSPRLVLARRDVEHYRAQIRLSLMTDMGEVADYYGVLLKTAEAEVVRLTTVVEVE